MEIFEISHKPLQLDNIEYLINNDVKLRLSSEVTESVQKCRTYLDDRIASSDEPIYGINTGFGSLYKESISNSEFTTLQENLIKSHACGAGDPIPSYIVKLILLLKIKSLSYGNSGVQVCTIERLIEMYNDNLLPRIYEYGSLGASGDLAPLAHLCLPLLGLGEIEYQGRVISGEEMLEIKNWKPIHLQAKEGLALLNGTQFMGAFGIWNTIRAAKLLKLANLIGAASIDAFDGRIEPFLPQVHAIRPQPGQAKVAAEVSKILADSEIINQHKKHVQDPYAFRCIPQVHGASLDAFGYVSNVFLSEINGVTDNPNIFPDEDMIISAGNFHGQPLALAHDFLAIAMAEIGSISERRTYQLISGNRGLPNYLVTNTGINSGLMIPQYTAASIVSQNKVLCHPASVDSIVSSNNQEDHVSMGAGAATKAFKVINNTYSIMAIELLTAAQALDLRKPLKTSQEIENLISNFRKEVPFIEYDRVLYEDIHVATDFLKNYQFD
ncbi:MAG: histidine ammonia-lyase [Bacteroidota bacterium]